MPFNYDTGGASQETNIARFFLRILMPNPETYDRMGWKHNLITLHTASDDKKPLKISPSDVSPDIGGSNIRDSFYTTLGLTTGRYYNSSWSVNGMGRLEVQCDAYEEDGIGGTQHRTQNGFAAKLKDFGQESSKTKLIVNWRFKRV